MAITICHSSKKINNEVEDNPVNNMPLHPETKGEDIEEKKEDILAPAPSEIDQEREPMPLSNLHKATNSYRPPIPPSCCPQKANGEKLLKLKNSGSFMININIGAKKTTQEILI